jgi:tetratricopeptide (TPR) repeat protein
VSALDQAKALQRSGEARAAIGAYLAALAEGASAGEVHLQLGVLHSELGERDAAIGHLREVLRAEPAHADAHCMLGTVLYDGGDFAGAAEALEEALRLSPGFPEALFNLGLAHFELGRLGAASDCIRACHVANRGVPWNADPAGRLAAAPLPPLRPEEMATNRTKVRHDAEQLQYLLATGKLPVDFQPVVGDYRALLAALPRDADLGRMLPFDEQRHALVARTYKRPLHVESGAAPAGPVVNSALDFQDLERRYAEARPSVIAVDNLVTPEALEALRRFCRESTIWNDIKVGYLGAYFFDGFCCELLLRLAQELRERLPGIIRGQPLHMM